MCDGTGYEPLFFTVLIALYIADSPELLFGERAISIIIVPSMIVASGIPTSLAAIQADTTLGPILLLARPISSYAITCNLLHIASNSPPSRSLAK